MYKTPQIYELFAFSWLLALRKVKKGPLFAARTYIYILHVFWITLTCPLADNRLKTALKTGKDQSYFVEHSCLDIFLFIFLYPATTQIESQQTVEIPLLLQHGRAQLIPPVLMASHFFQLIPLWRHLWHMETASHLCTGACGILWQGQESVWLP